MSKAKRDYYLVIGLNNFWFDMCDTLKEANMIAKSIMKSGTSGYSCPETGYCPEKPEEVFVYKSKLVSEF